MTQKKLHPSVLQFKEFVKNHPKLVQEVRKGKATWQELYEEWYLLGEEDPRWESIGEEEPGVQKEKNGEAKSDLLSSIMGVMRKMDANQVQYHLNNLSQAIGAIQGLLSQFQGSNQPQQFQQREPQGPANPFSFRKD